MNILTGGFKIWECTFDLINFMSKNMDMFQFDNAKVLDLGCGAGIIGLYAMLRGATVYFQDYVRFNILIVLFNMLLSSNF